MSADQERLDRIVHYVVSFDPLHGYIVRLPADDADFLRHHAQFSIIARERLGPAGYKILTELKELRDEIAILKNPSDGRCMEIVALREQLKKLTRERDWAKSDSFERAISMLRNSERTSNPRWQGIEWADWLERTKETP